MRRLPSHSEWPCPTRDYELTVSRGIVATAMDSGTTRVRRRFRNPRRSAVLNFEGTSAQFDNWTRWMDDYGYEWFEIDLPRDDDRDLDGTRVARLTSEIEYRMIGYDFWRATVTVEFARE